MDVTLWLAAVLWIATAVWVGRIAVVWGVDRRGRWSLAPGDAPSPIADAPLVSVLIPARDEEESIGPCLATVRSQDHRRLEIVVIDDGSRDATVEVARRAAEGDERVTIVSAPAPPPGWMGKSAALWTAQARVGGEWLLFLDADVRLHPRALSVALHAARRDQADMISWLGRLRMESFWERTIMPVMADLIARWAPVWRVNLSRSGACLANGQFILFRREAYDAIGGHGAVRGEVAEDVALCRRVKRGSAAGRSLRYHLYRAERLMEVRMYRSLRSIWLGFAKNAYAGLVSPARTVGAVVVIAVLDVLPWGVAATGWMGAGAAWPPAVAAVAATLVHRAATSRGGFAMTPYALLHPLGALVAAGILVDSTLRGLGWREPAAWKGRPVGGLEGDRRI